MTDFDDDLHEMIILQKSLPWQIIDWLINTDTYKLRRKSRSATHGYLRFELPAFKALDEAVVQGGRLENALRVELEMGLLKWRLFV